MPRPRRLCLFVCGLAFGPVGCFLWHSPHGELPSDKVVVAASPADAGPIVVFDTRLVEQPFADDYLNRRMWADLSDPLPHKLSALLAANGVRVGVRGGSMPADLARLAADDTSVSPTARRGPPDTPKPIPVNGPLDRCKLAVTPGLTDDPRRLDLGGAECAVVAAGTPRPDGRVTVRCQLVVQHGATRPRWTPTADGGFDRTEGRTAEAFPPLAFEVTLDPSEVLVVGPTEKADDSLGSAFFHTAGGANQRALVLRAASEGGSAK